MKTEKTNRTIEAKQTIEFIKFNKVFSLYKLTTVVGEQTLYKTGICLNSEIEEFKKTPNLFFSLFKVVCLHLIQSFLLVFYMLYYNISFS